MMLMKNNVNGGSNAFHQTVWNLQRFTTHLKISSPSRLLSEAGFRFHCEGYSMIVNGRGELRVMGRGWRSN